MIDDVQVCCKRRGRPLLLPEEIDQLIKQFIQNMRVCGSPLSSSIVVAAAKGIALSKNQSLLREFGGPVELKKSWHIHSLFGMDT